MLPGSSSSANANGLERSTTVKQGLADRKHGPKKRFRPPSLNQNEVARVEEADDRRFQRSLENSTVSIAKNGKRTLKCMLTGILNFKILEKRRCLSVTQLHSGELGFLLASKVI